VYFLGVQVTDIKGYRLLNDEAIQRQLINWTYHAVWSLTECKTVFANKALSAQAKCHGVWYVNEGVLQGENAMRGHRLHSMLTNFELGVTGVKFFYVHVPMELQVRLMICSHLMTVEFKWKLMGAETLDGFKEALNYAIVMCVPSDEVRELRQVDLFDYHKLAREHGLSWMMGGMQ
jgi:hypothetical protein